MTTTTRARLLLLGGTALTGTALALAAPLAAQAHVGIKADSLAAGSSAVLSLDIPHGCSGSPTTKVTLQVPAGVNEVTPTVSSGWTVTKTTEKLAEPLTLEDGDQITKRTSQVVWTAKVPLPDGYRDVLSMELELPDDAAGRTLSFPVVQTCVEGSTDWTQVGGAGVDADDLEHPAPSITVSAAADAGDHGSMDHASAEATTDADGATAADDAASSSPAATTSSVQAQLGATGAAGTGSGLGLVALAVAVLGLATALLALVRGRSTRPGGQG